MDLKRHADHTEQLIGVRAEDIHAWIDSLFDTESFNQFIQSGKRPNYDPYEHRKHRHCKEALNEAYREFEEKYTHQQIKSVFETHLKDDYDGYIPHREDFDNSSFTEKYHESIEREQQEIILSEKELSEYFKGKKYPKKQIFSKKLLSGFGVQIVLPTVLTIFLFVFSIWFMILPVIRYNMMTEKKEMIKELTSSAASIAKYYIEMEKRGELSTEVAQKRATSEIKKMRYGAEGKDYFWITDMFPRMIMHPYRSDLVNQDLTQYKDSENKSGKKLFVEFVKLVQEKDEGYLEYLWQWKDDPTQTVPKLSYVHGISDWNWVIGTGVYVHDVEEEMDLLTQNLLVIFGIISLVLTFILFYIVSKTGKIENERQQAESGLIEAKERYRALVEASNEGYILEVGGENIYSSFTLQKMLGYTETEMIGIPIWKLLKANTDENAWAINYLEKLMDGLVKGAEFEAQLTTKIGKQIDVTITTSRIFLSEKVGHIISFRPIVHQKLKNGLFSKIDNDVYLGTSILNRKVSDLSQKVDLLDSDIDYSKRSIKRDDLILEAWSKLIHTKEGYLVVEDSKNEVIGYKEIARMIVGLPVALISEIENGETVGKIIESLNRLPGIIIEMSKRDSNPQSLRHLIGKVYETAIRRFIDISLKKSDIPPVSFSFLSLGSNARREMTMFSDQDNALVFSDVEEKNIQKTRLFFLTLARSISSMLEKAGYPLCPGGIMAMNPKWCLSISEWKTYFSNCILKATPDTILEVNVFMDMRSVYGEKTLADELQCTISDLSKRRPEFFMHYAQNCLLYKPPLNLFGGIKSESKRGLKTINVKDALKPIELFARIYALKNEVTRTGTIARLKSLLESKVLKADTYHEMVYVFDYLWRLRFENQLISHSELKKVGDEIDLSRLTEIELNNLKSVLSSITTFQKKLSFDFFGRSI